jgi:hypothetical protein
MPIRLLKNPFGLSLSKPCGNIRAPALRQGSLELVEGLRANGIYFTFEDELE